jgi:hypothetical protein
MIGIAQALLGDPQVLSALPHKEGTLYHVVGPEPRGDVRHVQSLSPTLEDGYIWLRKSRVSKATLSAGSF